ncbi:MAG: hypothetical protein ABIF82_08355 [Planctomycetota bacterium]
MPAIAVCAANTKLATINARLTLNIFDSFSRKHFADTPVFGDEGGAFTEKHLQSAVTV